MKPDALAGGAEVSDGDDLLRGFLARGLAAQQAADAASPAAAAAALVDELERALDACASVAAGEAWPGGEFSASVEAVLRKYLGSCGHFTHAARCSCEDE